MDCRYVVYYNGDEPYFQTNGFYVKDIVTGNIYPDNLLPEELFKLPEKELYKQVVVCWNSHFPTQEELDSQAWPAISWYDDGIFTTRWILVLTMRYVTDKAKHKADEDARRRREWEAIQNAM